MFFAPTSLSHLVRKVSAGNAANAARDVRRHSHELSRLVCVSHTLDNSWKEDTDRIERSVDAWGDAC